MVFYGGNFAVRRDALERIGGFDTSIDFHGEDTNVGRRLFSVGRVALAYDCFLYTSARRYTTMGKGRVFRVYVRNFVSELWRHRPKDWFTWMFVARFCAFVIELPSLRHVGHAP